MAKGYTGRRLWWIGMCRCCKSGPRAKFCCRVCGHVCKAPWEGRPYCPGCNISMVCMGDKWRPLKKKKWQVNADAAQNQFEYLQRLREVRG